MRKSMLVHLPAELLYSIIEKLPRADIFSLRRTCQRLNSFVSPVLFKSIYLGFLGDEDFGFIAATGANSFIAPFVRHLRLFSPSWLSEMWPPVEETGEDNLNPRPEYAGNWKHLVSFVKGLQNLRSIEWNYRSYNIQHSLHMEQVTVALGQIASLKELNLIVGRSDARESLPDVSEFKALTSLHITYKDGTMVGIGDYLMSSVLPALAALPMLKCFSLSISEGRCHTSLDALLHGSGVWCTNPTIELSDLKLAGVAIQLDPRVRRIFQNLKHLTLAYGNESVDVMERIAWQDIWDALYEAGRNEGLWLETLDTEGAQPPVGLNALFNYLQAHPGLKGLSIRRPPYEKVPKWWDHELQSLDSDMKPTKVIEVENQENRQRATMFWCNVLPRLGHSLRELTVIPVLKGPWSYGPEASSALQHCRVLEKLTISVSSVDVEWAKGKAEGLEMIPSSSEYAFGIRRSELSYILSQPVRWGEMQSTPVLLASDLGELPRLKEVVVKLTVADFDRCGGSGGRKHGIRTINWQARQTLRWFVPCKGYPHKLTGEGGIMKISFQ